MTERASINQTRILMYFVDFPIHPPRKEGDPFDVVVDPPLNLVMRMVDGVMHVYDSDEMADNGKPIEWPYPDTQSYLAEYNIMLSLITDGPL